MTRSTQTEDLKHDSLTALTELTEEALATVVGGNCTNPEHDWDCGGSSGGSSG